MKVLLPILFWTWPCFAISQAKDSMKAGSIPVKDSLSGTVNKTYHRKPEILSSGFIDVVNNGQVNASARFIRLYIGEPGKFAFPLSIYSGVSSNYFQNQQIPGGQRSNAQLVSQFINPLGGLANMSIEGISFVKPKKLSLTKTGILYHGGIRILTGYKTGPPTDPSTGSPVNFLNSFATGGIYFQTGAWERNDQKNVGVFWLAGRYIFCKSGEKQLEDILPGILTDGFYHGWSLAWGVEVSELVNIKVVYYQYVKRPEIDYSLPIYQFSFNYSLR